jgi:hypothetical protein
MNTILEDNLVDDLLATIDEIRQDMFDITGIRSYRCFVVVRTWTGDRIGTGSYTDGYQELLPYPKIEFSDSGYEVLAGGRQSSDIANASEISIRYSELELMPATTRNQELWYRLDDLHGEGIASRYFVPMIKAWPDREQSIGWIVSLKERQMTDTGINGVFV